MTTILVVVNRLTKVASFILVKGVPNAEQTADLMAQKVFKLHGIPGDIASNRRVQFILEKLLLSIRCFN